MAEVESGNVDASRYQPEPPEHRTGNALCLSGGGFRAALFHLGAMRRLNEVGLLSRMNTISSVSGGSVANALLAKVWPSLRANLGDGAVFRRFDEIYEMPLREFCARDIRTGPLLWDRLDPRNWMTLWSHDHSATDFLSDTYRDHLLGDLRLSHLAEIESGGGPKFVIDATNLQTGVNFEFTGTRVGDYKIGYAAAPELPLAEAVAASSSFPIAFPPLVLKFDEGRFSGGDIEKQRPANPDLAKLRRRIVLSDGGVYDNLGTEPVWKHHALVLCSDGGKPLETSLDPGQSPVSRLTRANAVIMNQADAVRKRWLISSLERGVYRGAYWGIGTAIEDYAQHGQGYEGLLLERLRAVRTDFNSFSEDEQLTLMNHGWALADAALRTRVASDLPAQIPAGQCPSAALLDPGRAQKALEHSDQMIRLGR